MKPFVVLGTQRTGTTLIRTSLDSHPDVSCHGEIFVVGRWPYQLTHRMPYSLPDGFWAYRRSSLSTMVSSLVSPNQTVKRFLDRLYAGDPTHAVGFKLMLTEAQRFPAAVRYLIDHRIPAIHVLRRNLLDVLISRRIARLTGVYHRTDDDKTPTAARRDAPAKLQFEPAKILREIQLIADEDRRWQELVYGQLQVQRIYYEDFVQTQQASSNSLLSFVQVTPRPLSSPLRKVVTSNWRNIVANPQVVETALQATEFEHLLR